MKTLLRALPLILLGLVSLRAAERGSADVIAAVTAADAARQRAFIEADEAELAAILSDELRYAHSNGKVDTKAMLMETLLGGSSDYQSFDYEERNFTPAGPGVVLMSGRVIVGLRNADGPQRIDLNFLAVWREEGGRWRFLAWQSCRNPVAAVVGATKR